MTDEQSRVPDKGPWRAQQTVDGQVVLFSEDFEHDAMLRVGGDFGSAASRLAYGDYLARLLSAGCARAHAQADLADEGALMQALNVAMAGPAGDLLTRAANELARMRIALAQADAALAQWQTQHYLRHQVQAAGVPSAFALALQACLLSKAGS